MAAHSLERSGQLEEPDPSETLERFGQSRLPSELGVHLPTSFRRTHGAGEAALPGFEAMSQSCELRSLHSEN